jgi:5-methylcytosine-specific restriction endonuclease McrA
MSIVRVMRGGWVDRKSVPRGPNGRGLCRWCSLEVPKRRFTFCSEFCVHEWKLRTQPGYVRDQVFKRDKGICSCCHINTLAEARRLRYARGVNQKSLLEHWGLKARTRKSLWDADHIVPVAEGGGQCDLDNIRTLCLRCHRAATLELRRRLRMKPLSSEALLASAVSHPKRKNKDALRVGHPASSPGMDAPGMAPG